VKKERIPNHQSPKRPRLEKRRHERSPSVPAWVVSKGRPAKAAKEHQRVRHLIGGIA